jgi:hypothetical protein
MHSIPAVSLKNDQKKEVARGNAGAQWEVLVVNVTKIYKTWMDGLIGGCMLPEILMPTPTIIYDVSLKHYTWVSDRIATFAIVWIIINWK